MAFAAIASRIGSMLTYFQQTRHQSAVAQVMSTWQTVFRGIQVAQCETYVAHPKQCSAHKCPLPPTASVAAQTHGAQDRDGDGEVEAERLANLTPDTLVRVPVDKRYNAGAQEPQDFTG